MGTDIDGWIEIRYAEESDDWFAVVDASVVLERDYQMFGSLFGVRNRSALTPVAPGRGVPADASDVVCKEASWKGYHSHTWLTWAEVEEVNWEETTEEVFGVASVGEENGHDRSHSVVYLANDDPRKQEGVTWEQNGFHYTARRVTRWEMIGTRCQVLLGWMRYLGKKYGGDSVRLVVYFDS